MGILCSHSYNSVRISSATPGHLSGLWFSDIKYNMHPSFRIRFQPHFQGGWVSKSAHLTLIVIDAPTAHAVDEPMGDLGLAVWITATIYPVITLEEAVGGLPE